MKEYLGLLKKKKKSRGQEIEIRLAKADLLNQGDRYVEAPTGLPTYAFVSKSQTNNLKQKRAQSKKPFEATKEKKRLQKPFVWTYGGKSNNAKYYEIVK